MIDRTTAIEAISTGHAIYTPAFAREVCKRLGVRYRSKPLVRLYESDKHPLGVTMYDGKAACGVWSLELGRYIAEQLGVKAKAQQFLGRGSQAREYARVITANLAA